MADVASDAGSGGNIIQREIGDQGVELHEEPKRLTDAAGRSKHGHLATGSFAGHASHLLLLAGASGERPLEQSRGG